jgi:dTDP-4-dehydrorhamnose 3,5-epimerase
VVWIRTKKVKSPVWHLFAFPGNGLLLTPHCYLEFVIFTETKLPGALLIEPEKLEDGRGFFARSWCCREFEANGLNPRLVQCDISFSHNKGTLRGMHYQVAPFSEVKLVRCTRGSIYDVIIDLRPDSPTFKDHMGVILSAENHKMLYVPEGFAHGFVTLEDSTEVLYQMSEFYAPEHGRGVRWNDRTFEICWPIVPTIMSERDRTCPDFCL